MIQISQTSDNKSNAVLNIYDRRPDYIESSQHVVVKITKSNFIQIIRNLNK